MNDHTAPALLKHKAKAALARTIAQSFGIATARRGGGAIPAIVPANDPIASHVGRNTTISEKNLVTG